MFAVHDDTLSVDVNEGIYTRDALLRTAYWFTDRCYIFISRLGENLFRVQFKAKAPAAEVAAVALEEIAGEFLNALLDHQVRQDIESETGRVRELLLAKAFAEAGVLEDPPPGDVGDPIERQRGVEDGLVQIERQS